MCTFRLDTVNCTVIVLNVLHTNITKTNHVAMILVLKLMPAHTKSYSVDLFSYLQIDSLSLVGHHKIAFGMLKFAQTLSRCNHSPLCAWKIVVNMFVPRGVF